MVETVSDGRCTSATKKMNTNVTKITVLVFLALLASTLALQCIDDYGNAVDWYVVSKFPKLSGGDDALKAGHRYMYLDSDETFWTVSEKTINDYDGAVFHTLEPVYNSDVGYLMYNDAFPDTVHAHSTAGQYVNPPSSNTAPRALLPGIPTTTRAFGSLTASRTSLLPGSLAGPSPRAAKTTDSTCSASRLTGITSTQSVLLCSMMRFGSMLLMGTSAIPRTLPS